MAVTFKPTKRALLVGIEYVDTSDPLLGPKQDVLTLSKFIVERCGYSEDNIVVMHDSLDDSTLRPTSTNLLRAMDDLVRDVYHGDHCLFHFAGHATQTKNLDGTEEDGMDEHIQTLDGTIRDNELKSQLVDRLPPGSSLVAIFDTCHSETILDLPHYNCNRILPPWMETRHGSGDSFRAGTATGRRLRIHETKKATAQRVKSRRSTMDISPKGRVSLSIVTQIDPPSGEILDSEIVDSPTMEYSDGAWSWPDGTWSPESPEDPAVSLADTSSSYTLESPPFCEGNCSCPGHTQDVFPRVTAFGAARDSQWAWQNQHGESMTKVMVDILDKNPYLTLGNLTNQLTRKFYDQALMRQGTKEWKEIEPEHRTKRWQLPSVAGLYPLDFNERFTL